MKKFLLLFSLKYIRFLNFNELSSFVLFQYFKSFSPKNFFPEKFPIKSDFKRIHFVLSKSFDRNSKKFFFIFLDCNFRLMNLLKIYFLDFQEIDGTTSAEKLIINDGNEGTSSRNFLDKKENNFSPIQVFCDFLRISFSILIFYNSGLNKTSLFFATLLLLFRAIILFRNRFLPY